MPPGRARAGHTREEALVNVKEATQVCLEELETEGRPIPQEKFEALLVAV